MTGRILFIGIVVAGGCSQCGPTLRLDMPVRRFRAVKARPVQMVDEIMRRTGVRATIEISGEDLRGTDLLREGDFSLFFHNGTLRELLDAIVAVDRRYAWTVSGQFVHFLPSDGGLSPDYVMNEHIDAFEMAGKDISDMVHKLDQQLGGKLNIRFTCDPTKVPGFPPFQLSFPGPLRLSFPGGTVRDLADLVASSDANGYWFFVSKEVLNRVQSPPGYPWFDEPVVRDWLVIAYRLILKDVPTATLLHELKDYHIGDPVPDNLIDIADELGARASDEVETLIRAYSDPANRQYVRMRQEVASALSGVRSERAKRFLLQALAETEEDDPYLVQTLGYALSGVQPTEEALPLLRKIAESATANKVAREAARLYVRSLERRFTGTGLLDERPSDDRTRREDPTGTQ